MTPDAGIPAASNGRRADRSVDVEIPRTVSQAAAIARLEQENRELCVKVEFLMARQERFMWALAGYSGNGALASLEERGKIKVMGTLPYGDRERLIRSNAASTFEAAVSIDKDKR